MAKRIRKKNIVEFDQVSQRWKIEAMIMCDSESDLPAIDEFDNYLLAQGSLAIVIDTSDRYRITSDGTWDKNSSGGGSATLIEKSISVNGTYNASNDNADGYRSVSVSVPNTYTAEDEGKVVDNGSLVAQTAMSTEITTNDTYDTTLYNSVTVNVPQGGSSESKDVNFYDYDGTVVASYTASEFAELTSMPDNPMHDGLTAQGWNWTLSDAKTYVEEYGKLNIGQMYITSDGKTRLYITLPEGRTSPWLKLYLNTKSEIDIDWGDESAHSTFTSTNGGYKNEQHVYAGAGDYTIAITVVSGSFVLQSSSTSLSTVLTNNNNSPSSPDKAYLSSIKRIEIGRGVTSIGSSAFQSCYSLSSITINKPEGSISGSPWGAKTSAPTSTQIVWTG